MSSARDGRDDADLIARLELGLEAAREAHVLLADVDVDEATDALLVEEAIAEAGVLLLEVLDHVADGAAGGLHLVGSSSEASERGGDSDDGVHGWLWGVGLGSEAHGVARRIDAFDGSWVGAQRTAATPRESSAARLERLAVEREERAGDLFAAQDGERQIGLYRGDDADHGPDDAGLRAGGRVLARHVLEEAAIAGPAIGTDRERRAVPANRRRVDDGLPGDARRVGGEELRGEVVAA